MRANSFYILLIVFFGAGSMLAQNKHNSALLLDLGGIGGSYCVTGEYSVSNYTQEYSVSIHAGIGYLPFNDTEFVGVPVGLSLLTGKKAHHFEAGLGVSYIKGFKLMTFPSNSVFNVKSYASEGIYFSPTIGYRYDLLKNGIIFRIYYSPLITVYDYFSKEKFLNQLLPSVSGFDTKTALYEYYSKGNNYPTAQTQLVWCGLSVGYRF